MGTHHIDCCSLSVSTPRTDSATQVSWMTSRTDTPSTPSRTRSATGRRYFADQAAVVAKLRFAVE